MRADNFSVVAVGGLADVIEQVRHWHNGVRVFSSEEEAWDSLIHRAHDRIHRTDGRCECAPCRPNRRYK
jgi:glycogen synthase